MRFILAMLCGKILAALGRATGKGTNLPGEIALKICPDLLGKIHCTGTIVAVSGSNGKTTTANLLSYLLTSTHHTVVNNAKGSNLTGGVATALLSAADLKGTVRSEYVVLEVDERYSPLIFRYFSPDYLLCTNLFRDQLTRNGNVDIIIEKLNQAIKPEVKLVLNGNDPISADLLPKNERVYYGLARTSLSTDTSFNITHDAKVCPRCYGKMSYDYFHYNHIGKFYCEHCGYATPVLNYTADQADMQSGDFQINHVMTHTDYKSLFHLLNITAAVAIAGELGIPLTEACEAVSHFTIMKQRYEEFSIHGRKALMILSKNQNPVSYDQSISYVLSLPEEKSVIIVVNNINHTYQKDTTWLYDISFERLVHQVDKVICCGQRAYDLAVRLKLAGFKEEELLIEPSISAVKPVTEQTKGTLCILTELYDAKAILKVVKE